MDQAHNAQNGQEYDLERQDPELPHPLMLNHAGEVNNPSSPEHEKPIPNVNGAHPLQDLDPAAERLARDLTPLSNEDFYSLIGIRIPTSPTDGIEQLVQPNGLYSKIYRQMRYNNRKFKVFDIAAYALLFVQIVISAIFIILGSLHHVDTHLTIAILGAVATLISGALALMKGQGLPNRLRQTRDSLRDVMFEAEELYWDVKSGRPVLYKDIKKIREGYLRVLVQARQNHPDVWNKQTDGIAQGASKESATRTAKNL